MNDKIWVDIETATRDQMVRAFQHPRQKVVSECRQIDRDLAYFNEYHSSDNPIPFVFDFTSDVEEWRVVDAEALKGAKSK